MIVTQVTFPARKKETPGSCSSTGAGAICETPEATAEKIVYLLADRARVWREWEANIAKLSRPDAASVRIAEAVLREIGH